MPDLLTEITPAAQAYYAQATSLQLTATDRSDWLATLPPARQQAAPGFLRHCLEGRAYSRRSFMAEQLALLAYARPFSARKRLPGKWGKTTYLPPVVRARTKEVG